MKDSEIEGASSQEVNEEPSGEGGEEDDIEDIPLEEVIPAAAGGNEEALWALLLCNWLTRLLERVSGWAEWQFKGRVKAEEIRDFLFDRVRLDITKLTNPRKTSWKKALRAYLYRAARNRSLNNIRHLGYEDDYSDKLARELTSPPDVSQEEAFDRVFFRSNVREAVWQVYRGLDPEDAGLMMQSAHGKTLQKMSEGLGVSVATVSRRLKVPEKKFVTAVMRVIAEEFMKMKPGEEGEKRLAEILEEHQDGVLELIENSLLEIEDHLRLRAGA